MRLIDADLFIKEKTVLYCGKCERRMGMKNGKKTFVYEIGDVPCRACEVMDMFDAIDNAPTFEYPFYQEAYQTGHEEGKNDRPQGEWIFDERGYFYCDQCGKYPNDQVTATDFCPKCGAKMKGGVE